MHELGSTSTQINSKCLIFVQIWTQTRQYHMLWKTFLGDISNILLIVNSN